MGHGRLLVHIIIDATLIPIRGGVLVRNSRVHLAAVGPDCASAIRSLERVVGSWAVVLAARGELKTALHRIGVRYEEDDNEVITVSAMWQGDFNE